MLGMRDCWTARSFDSAVMAFGVWAENKLNERDEDGNLINSLQDVLQTEPDMATALHNNTVQAQMMKILLGGH